MVARTSDDLTAADERFLHQSKDSSGHLLPLRVCLWLVGQLADRRVHGCGCLVGEHRADHPSLRLV